MARGLEAVTAEPETAQTSGGGLRRARGGRGAGAGAGAAPSRPLPGASGGGDQGGSHTRCARARLPGSPRAPCPPRRCARPPCGPTG